MAGKPGSGPGKGKTNNPHGRKKGVPNKATKDIREVIRKVLEDYSPMFWEDLRALQPKDRVKAITDLLQYAVPKMSTVQSDLTLIDGREVIKQLFPEDSDIGQVNQ